MKNDLISRRAAIRWVKTECNPYGKPTLDYESGKKVIEHLEAMPSAQPEIIRCGECAHKDKKIDYCHYLGITICERDYCSYGERRTDEGD